MKKYIAFLLAGVLLTVACGEKESGSDKTGKGPEMNILCDASAEMGNIFNFSVDIKDDVALSTLKVEILFDESVVASETIRTRDNGTYDGSLEIPFYKNVPDGVATARFTAQNIHFGTSTEDKDVSISRPEFAYLTLRTTTGVEYRMEEKSKYVYAVTGNFPAAVEAFIETAPYGGDDRTLTFGYNASDGITLDGAKPISFSNGISGNYEITFNVRSWTGTPLVTIEVNGVEASLTGTDGYAAIVNLKKGDAVNITGYEPGFDDFTYDPDFIDNNHNFAALDGLYRVTVKIADKWVLVDRMATATSTATLSSDGHGAVWIIGDKCFGKPSIFPYGWNTDYAVCMAEVEPKIYQATLVGGTQISTDNVNIKLYHQKGWGGEFKKADYASIQSEYLDIPNSDGNIHLASGATLEAGGAYVLRLDLTGGLNAARFSCFKAGQQGGEVPVIAINDVEFGGGPLVFTADVDLKQGEPVSITGVDNLSSYWVDPDYFGADGKFIPVTGLYRITLDKGARTLRAWMMNKGGTRPNIEQGGLYVMGWGVAAYKMTAQCGWSDFSNSYQMAQIRPGVFRMTGTAVTEKDGRPGGRFRIDYTDLKWFYAYGSWDGQDANMTLTEDAKKWVKGVEGGNLFLVKEGVVLDEGATYVLTVDFTDCALSGATVTGSTKVDFRKL